MKKVKKTTLRNKADSLFSKSVRSLGYCQLKGKDNVKCGGPLQTMHIITRGHTALRYDENNVICGCSGHHVYYTWHPDAWLRIVAFAFPEKWAHVTQHIHDTVKKTEELYRNVIEKYTEAL